MSFKKQIMSLAVVGFALMLVACSSSNNGGGGGGGTQTPQFLVVSNSFDGQSINVYNIAASGDTAPLRTITGAATLLDSPSGVVVANNLIWAANFDGGTVTAYPLTADGNQAPVVLFSATTGTLLEPFSIIANNNELYVSDFSSSEIAVFSATTASGAAPTRIITGFDEPAGMAIDGGLLYVADRGNNAVYVMNSSASGAFSATRTITGANTLFAQANALAISGDQLFVGNFDVTGQILVFDKTLDGNVAPTQVIDGSNTGLTDSTATFVINGTDLFVGNETAFGSGGPSPVIRVFKTTDTGNVAPTRTIEGAATLLSDTPEGVAVF